jgi:hypothetical protein
MIDIDRKRPEIQGIRYIYIYRERERDTTRETVRQLKR